MALVPMANAQQMVALFKRSADLTNAEAQQTATDFEIFMGNMQMLFAGLTEQNHKLEEALVIGESREREMTKLHKAELAASQGKIDSLEKILATTRESMVKAAAKAETQIAAAIRDKTVAVATAVKAGQAQTAAQVAVVMQEKRIAVEAAVKEGKAQTEAARQAGMAEVRAQGQLRLSAVRHDLASLSHEIQKDAVITYMNYDPAFPKKPRTGLEQANLDVQRLGPILNCLQPPL